MALMKWDATFSVGVEEVDEQHKKLFMLINLVFDAMKAGKGAEVLKLTIDELIDYTHTHFSYEEKYFSKFNYEHTKEHKLEHKKFIDKITDFQKEYESGTALLSTEILNFLKDWLTTHIKVIDKKYTACFNKNGLK